MKTVLLVEDDPVLASLAQMALESVAQLEVKHVASGRAALEALEQWRPDAILMDFMMPGMDGMQVLITLRERGLADGVPVVFMTARAQQHEIAEYTEAGAAGVITKPFDPMTLGADLKRVVAESGQ